MIGFYSTINPAITGQDFNARINPGVKANKTDDVGYYNWGGSVLKYGTKYYLFYNKWIAGSPNAGGFDGWIYFNRIYRRESDNLTGPFTNESELTELRTQTWSAGAVMNPYPIYYNGLYYLFYTGTISATQAYPIVGKPARENQKIGVAYTSDPSGEWTVSESNPIIAPRPGEFDSTICNNPVPFVGKDGIIRCIYKTYISGTSDFRLAVAKLSTMEGPIISRAEIVSGNYDLEDATVWKERRGKLFMIAKTFDEIDGVEAGGGVLFQSDYNGDSWEISEIPLAYHLTINWSDNTSQSFSKIERPFIYNENNQAKAIFTAVLEGSNAFNIGRLLDPL